LLNQHQHPKNATPGKKAKDLSLDHPNLDPANSYLKDHHVDVLHVGSHGTYKVGKEDKTGHGLPEFKGEGRWISKEKHKDDYKRTIQFSVRHADKSHVDLGKDEHAHAMAKTLGHLKEDVPENHEEHGTPFDK